MSAGFTPVPWTAKERAIEATVNGKPFLVSGYALNSDARLMAAAPDLLAALQDFASDCTNEECERCIAARAAIRKATGQ